MLRVLELFCGIGGCAAALGDRATVVAAIDINRKALEVYARNFPHPTWPRTLDTLRTDAYRAWDADLWWLSPPCQPFTVRGLRRDLEDPRSRAFLAVLQQIEKVRPPYVALENVPGFSGSDAHRRLFEVLAQSGYQDVFELELCPSELGVPNRRRRYYLVAGRDPLERRPFPRRPAERLRDVLDPDPDPSLDVSAEILERYRGALHLVDAQEKSAITACFTSAYGRSYVHSGSYLRTPGGARRFSPQEILRLLSFPPDFLLPAELPVPKAWRLVANSLSLQPVRFVLSSIPELRELFSSRTFSATVSS